MQHITGICLQSFIPVRESATEKSEMVTQLLFGEIFSVTVYDKETGFSLIINQSDNYEGWIDEKTISYLPEKDLHNVRSYPEKVVRDREFRVVDIHKNEMWLSAGSILRIQPGNNIYGTLSMFSPDMNKKDKRQMVEISAMEWVNVSYLWGGKSTFGTDCSGLIQNLYKQVGLNISRDTSQQAVLGRNINFIFESQPGDLAFFDDNENNIKHVGMILSGNRIIHASGKVRTDLFDQQGIYSREKGNYTHKLRVMRNLLD